MKSDRKINGEQGFMEGNGVKTTKSIHSEFITQEGALSCNFVGHD